MNWKPLSLLSDKGSSWRHQREFILLKAEWGGYWECHIAPDWLLIYRTTEQEVLLARTGTHADLFEL